MMRPVKLLVDGSAPGSPARYVPLTAEELAQRERDHAEGCDNPGVVGARIDPERLRDLVALAEELVPGWGSFPDVRRSGYSRGAAPSRKGRDEKASGDPRRTGEWRWPSDLRRRRRARGNIVINRRPSTVVDSMCRCTMQSTSAPDPPPATLTPAELGLNGRPGPILISTLEGGLRP